MKPKTLSASAAQCYESCPARFNAEYVLKAKQPSNSAAALGTACHGALDCFIKANCHINPAGFNLTTLLKFYDTEYWKVFVDKDRYDEGVDLLTNWFKRADFSNRTVLSTEVKSTFELKLPTGESIPFTYIWDRCDELPDGSIEVIDYKSMQFPIGPERLKKLIQARAYALAAAIQYPNRPAYWVSYDLLRWDIIGAKFTREDNIETYRYLQALFARILADDGTTETLNPECRYCVRNSSCETLQDHVSAGGILRLSDPYQAADHRANLDYAYGAIKKQLDEVDEFLMTWAENEGLLEFKTNKTEVTISAGNRRDFDNERVAKLLGPEIMLRYGKIQLKDLDEIMKSGELDDSTRSQLKQLIRKRATKAILKTKPLAALGEE